MSMPGPPDDGWRAWYQRGLDADDLAAARDCFDRAIEAGADQWQPYYARAWVTVQAVEADEEISREENDRRLDDAVKDLDRALDEFGGGLDAAALRGHVAARQGDHELAVEFFLRAVGRSSQIRVVELGLTDSLAALLAQLESAADGDGVPDALAACERLERMLATAPVNPGLAGELLAEVLATLAYCHQQAGDTEQAEADLRRVAQLVPGHPRVPADLPREAGVARTSQRAAREPSFASVGGLAEPGTFMDTLRQLFEVYFGGADAEAARQRLASHGRSPTRSILLFGPSGCGKTYVIQSFAGEYRKRHRKELPIVKLRLDAVLERYVGESEKAITRLINQAIELQPSILFADEIDAIGKSREDGQDWRIDMTAHWLLEVDRLRDSGAAIIFFGCTNRIWAVDLAMLRRFDRVLPVELPTANVRAEIFDVCLRGLGPPVRPTGVDTARLAAATHGLTPGDIRKVVNRALDDLLVGKDGAAADRELTEDDLLRALREYKQPMHVSEWVRQSVRALRAVGQDDMAAEVERSYGPYVEDVRTLLRDNPSGPVWRSMPPEAWAEQPEFDLSSMRLLRRRP
jgi:ATP-dependent 26S proteasome regulatory subunit